MTKKTIWITGASSGIGKALALEYAAEGHQLILSARRRNELEAVAVLCQQKGAKCYVLDFDLGNIKDANNLVNEALSFTGSIDILINNGGISQRALAVDTDMEVTRKFMEVNFFGQIALSRALLPHFIKAGTGHFVVMSSFTGLFGYGLRSSYAASKHALHGYFESLAIENHANNIVVSMVCPGRILTDISLNALTGDGTKNGTMDEGQAKGVSAERCAQIIIRGVYKRKRLILVGKMDKLMVYIKRFWPGLFFKIAVKLDPTK